MIFPLIPRARNNTQCLQKIKFTIGCTVGNLLKLLLISDPLFLHLNLLLDFLRYLIIAISNTIVKEFYLVQLQI